MSTIRMLHLSVWGLDSVGKEHIQTDAGTRKEVEEGGIKAAATTTSATAGHQNSGAEDAQTAEIRNLGGWVNEDGELMQQISRRSSVGVSRCPPGSFSTGRVRVETHGPTAVCGSLVQTIGRTTPEMTDVWETRGGGDL